MAARILDNNLSQTLVASGLQTRGRFILRKLAVEPGRSRLNLRGRPGRRRILTKNGCLSVCRALRLKGQN